MLPLPNLFCMSSTDSTKSIDIGFLFLKSIKSLKFIGGKSCMPFEYFLYKS